MSEPLWNKRNAKLQLASLLVTIGLVILATVMILKR
jgi:hypothetical protein